MVILWSVSEETLNVIVSHIPVSILLQEHCCFIQSNSLSTIQKKRVTWGKYMHQISKEIKMNKREFGGLNER